MASMGETHQAGAIGSSSAKLSGQGVKVSHLLDSYFRAFLAYEDMGQMPT